MLNYYVGLVLRSWDRKLFVTALNIWMVSRFQLMHLQYGHAVVSGVIVLLLGQLAVLWPAPQAPKSSPGMATRGMDRISPLPFFNLQ